MQVKITVVTITYNLIRANRADTFRQNVESVQAQTYPEIEHVIIDGASNDGTLDLIESCKNDKMRVLSEPDHGIYEAMNKGLKQAKGDYILYLNSDDFLCRPDGLENCARILEQTNADLIYAPHRMMDEKTGRVFKMLEPCLGVYFVRMPFSHQAVLVKRDKMLELGGFDEQFKSAGDYDLLVRLINNGAKAVYYPNEFSTFRTGGMSWKQMDLSQRECIMSHQKIFGAVCPNCNWTQMLFDKKVPDAIVQYVLKRVDKSVRVEIEKVLKQAERDKKGIWHIQNEQEDLTFHKDLQTMYIGRLRLFGVIPVGQLKVLPDRYVYTIFKHSIWTTKRNKEIKNAFEENM